MALTQIRGGEFSFVIVEYKIIQKSNCRIQDNKKNKIGCIFVIKIYIEF